MASQVIGLDIGTHAVRAVELSLGRGRPVVRRMGQVTLPAGAVQAGEVVDATEVAAALKRLWKEVGFKSTSVVVGVANSRVVARMTDLPALPDNELRTSLPYQVQDLIPIPIAEAELDFQVIDRFQEEDGTDRVRVLLVAAHRDMLRSLLATLEGAGLSAARIDLVPFALIRALHDPGAWLDGDVAVGGHEVIVGAGAGVTNVVVHDNGVPRFVRTLPTGGGSVTEALAADLGLEEEAAEALKRGITGADPMADRRVDDIASASLMPLVNEIAGSLDFHLAQAGDEQLRRVVLSGGGARLRALRGVLEEQLGVAVVDGDPYKGLDLSKVPLDERIVAESADMFTVAIGLALSGEPLQGDAHRISLVPGEMFAAREERRRMMLAGAGVGGFAVLLVGLSFFRGTQVDSARADAERTEERASALQSQVAALHNVEQLQSDITTRTGTVTATLQNDVAWTSLFRDIAAVIPSDVWLESFSGQRLDLGGGTVEIAAKGYNQTSVARWLLRSEELSSLDNVWLGSSKKGGSGEGDSVVTFSTTANLGPGALSDRAGRYAGDVK
jgi:type IV pilus assembly protein PilM